MSEKDPIRELAKKIYWEIDVNAGGRRQLDAIESVLRQEGVRVCDDEPRPRKIMHFGGESYELVPTPVTAEKDEVTHETEGDDNG